MTWLVANWNLVLGLGMTFAAVFVIPLGLFIHRLIKADVLRDSEKKAKALADANLKEFAKHREEIVGKLTALENWHSNLTEKVGRVEVLAVQLDSKVGVIAEQSAFMAGALEAIQKGLNGYMKDHQ